MPELDYRMETHTLANGLRVVVNEDHTVPTVAVNLWVKVGSRHEAPGKTGFAHLFEHLMFQGSRNVRSGEHFTVLMAQGARLNATTWFDRTNYFETLPRGAYELALWMEADRHGYLLDAVTQENLNNQRDVVKEEKRQRYDNVPYGHALTHLFGAVFPEDHPYHHPTIGSMEDLDAATLEDVHGFYRRYYRPGNTVLTLVGDLTAEEGFAAAERHFGTIPDQPVIHPDPVAPLVPVDNPARLDLHEPVPTARLYVAFRLPVDNTDEFLDASCALDVAGGLATSRLDRRLVRGEEVCHTASAGVIGLTQGASLGTLVLEVAEGEDVNEVADRVSEELECLAERGPTEAEVEAVHAQTERAWLSALGSMEERADHIGHVTALFDDPNLVNTFVDRVHAVDADRVRSAAQRWLHPGSAVRLAYHGTASAPPGGGLSGSGGSGGAEPLPVCEEAAR